MILFCQQNSKNLCNTKSPTLNTASESDRLWSEQKSGAFVLAVDLPSGINTDTGEVAEGAAHADLTVTFDSYKPLHVAESSAPLCGKIVCSDIGIRDEWHPEF